MSKKSASSRRYFVTSPLEMWAGIECTLNRVGDRYRDQLLLSGHYERESDIERLISLGVKTVRYPVLWERHSTNADAWRITDRVLARLREASIEPIVGLMHHGSGVDGATLVDSAFPEALARFAETVATRYPWVRHYTPVNEPLTTARFAGLYGVWYPHQRNDTAFVTALLNQTLATQRAMQAIRTVTPDATLVTTEDLGYTHATPALQYQARFENERRWLTWDLLLGRVHIGHPLWKYLSRYADAATLQAIAANASQCDESPILLGINHYLTSERYLDNAIAKYPKASLGGNRRHRYADVEAVRVREEGPLGVSALLQQAWERYGKPMAITEAHLACTREQQVQWLHEVWQAALDARAHGADVRAVTAWAAFGSFDWNSLLTRDAGVYESGLFDLRAPEPRPTALAAMVRALNATGEFDHPALHALPWWRDERRLLYRAPVLAIDDNRAVVTSTNAGGFVTPARSQYSGRPLLITGASGTLGYALVRLAGERGLLHRGLTRHELDITNKAQIDHWLDAEKPWAVINAAGWVRVDDAERDPAGCVRINSDGAELLAAACSARGIRFVNFSSDLVFSGAGSRPFIESDETAPLNVYGHSKDEGERRVRISAPESIVIRTGAFFGDWDEYNFVSRSLRALQNGETVRAPSDAVVSPTYVTDLVHAVLDLLQDNECGTWHLANSGALNWTDLARTAADMAGLNPRKIEACAGTDIGWTAPRPHYSALGSERASLLPSLENALLRFVHSRAWERSA